MKYQYFIIPVVFFLCLVFGCSKDEEVYDNSIEKIEVRSSNSFECIDPLDDLSKNYLSPGEVAPITVSTCIGFMQGSATGNEIHAFIHHACPVTINGLDGNDLIYGGLIQDFLFGSDGNDVIYGGSGDDIIHGGAGDDALFGQNGNNIIYGEDGENYLIGGYGDDRLFGGPEYDYLCGQDGDDFFDVGLGDADILGGDGTDTLSLAQLSSGLSLTLTTGIISQGGQVINFSNVEAIISTPYNDYIIGDDEANYFNMGDGDDTVYGGEGDDYLYGGSGNDILKADEGNDVLDGGNGNDYMEGRAGDDLLKGGDGNDNVRGGEGNDLLKGGDGDDNVRGGEGNDWLDGGIGDNTLKGDAGNDTIFGNIGIDYIYGGLDNDILHGNSGDDRLRGNEGNDLLTGGDGKDHMVGHDGDDELYGQKDDDALYGYSGNDILHGGKGVDRLIGGSGSDTFHFRLYDQDGTYDRLEDFKLSENDKIDISLIFVHYDIQQLCYVNSYDPVEDDINDFIELVLVGNKVKMFVDKDGNGSEYSNYHIATIYGSPDITLADLLDNNTLIVYPIIECVVNFGHPNCLCPD